MGVPCGIDLGTTYSAISWYEEAGSRVDTIDLDSADGSKVIRSVVYFPGDTSEPVVGEAAWNAARTDPERVIVGIKRSMGTGYKTAPIDGKERTPQEVSAEILKTLARDAQLYLGEEVKDVVITVPAHFGDNERAATEETGTLAGLNVLGILPEPHAAALAYSVEKVADIVDRHLLVYDLGGGTFDVTLIHATTSEDATDNSLNLKIETLCKDGNASLGGLDWDRALAEIVAEKVEQEHGIDIREDPNNEPTLMDNCEQNKRHLTRVNTVSIVADTSGHQAEVTRSEFEDRTRDLLLQTELLLQKVLEDAQNDHGIGKDQIDVMLTGGSTKMPMVKNMIEGVMEKPPVHHKNPELLVTIGAAYWAHLQTSDDAVVDVIVTSEEGEKEVRPVKVSEGGLVDISAYAVGVEVLRPDGQGGTTRHNSVVIPNGASYGENYEKDFKTAEDDMREIPVVLYKGDSDNIDECDPLVTFTISGLPSDLARGTNVHVMLGFNESGILQGEAEVETGQKVEILYDRSKRPPAQG